jgi:DNA-binding NarL/FixJ family response regulator
MSADSDSTQGFPKLHSEAVTCAAAWNSVILGVELTRIAYRRTMRILLVEDSPPICERLTELIEERGEHVVLGCLDTEASAVERITAEQPDVAIFDIRLREGNGIDALAAAKRLHPELLGIVMSSHLTRRHEQASRDAGAVCVLDKSGLDQIPSILSAL